VLEDSSAKSPADRAGSRARFIQAAVFLGGEERALWGSQRWPGWSDLPRNQITGLEMG